MPKVEENSMPSSLHYALTDSQCSICGGQLEWQAEFDNINQPKYSSQHCNQDYAIHIETVKVEILGKASKDKQGHEDEKISGLRRKRMNPKHYRWQKERKDNNNSSRNKKKETESKKKGRAFPSYA
jgi:hypothetical protein